VPALGSACLLAGIDFAPRGSVSVADMSGHTGVLVVDRTSVVIDTITYDSDCAPQSYRVRMNGPLSMPGPTGDIALTAVNFTLDVDASLEPALVVLSGGLESACLGGYVDVGSLAALPYPIDSFCPQSGSVDAGVPQFRYESGNRVDFDADGDGAIDVHDIPHCFDAQALTCS
jgi:hypothetical protein